MFAKGIRYSSEQSIRCLKNTPLSNLNDYLSKEFPEKKPSLFIVQEVIRSVIAASILKVEVYIIF